MDKKGEQGGSEILNGQSGKTPRRRIHLKGTKEPAEKKAVGDCVGPCLLDKEFGFPANSNGKPLEDFNKETNLSWFMSLTDLSVSSVANRPEPRN